MLFKILKTIKSNKEQEIFLVKFINGEEKIMKIFKSTKKKEVEICKYIKKTNPNLNCIIPRKIYKNKFINIYLENIIEGDNLNNFQKKKSFISISNGIIETLYELSKIKPSKNLYKILNIKNPINWSFYLNNNFNKFIKEIEKNRYLDFFTIKAIKKYWKDNNWIFKEISSSSFSLLHNDLNQENIIITNKNINYGIIDFEWAIIGDPLKDLSKLMFFLNRNPILKTHLFNRYKLKFNDINHFDLRLNLYWIYDMLNHIQQENYLLQYDNSNWKNYLIEEKLLIKNIIQFGGKT